MLSTYVAESPRLSFEIDRESIGRIRINYEEINTNLGQI